MSEKATVEPAVESILDPSFPPARDNKAGHPLSRRVAEPGDSGASDNPALENIRAELHAVQRRLTVADLAHAADRARVADLERQHDLATSKLHQDHHQVQRLIRGRVPRHRSLLAGQPRPPGGGPLEHIRHVLFTIELLRHLDTAPPPMLETPFDIPAMIFDLQDAARTLEAVASGLEAARAAVADSRSHLEAALAETDRVLAGSVRCLKKLGQLAE